MIKKEVIKWNKSWFIEASAVPVPAVVWLFVSGLIGLISMAKRSEV